MICKCEIAKVGVWERDTRETYPLTREEALHIADALENWACMGCRKKDVDGVGRCESCHFGGLLAWFNDQDTDFESVEAVRD